MIRVCAVAGLVLFTAAVVSAEPVTLARDSAVTFHYDSVVLGSPVASASLALDSTGRFLTAQVLVVPPNTFLQTLSFLVDPPHSPALVGFSGYRDVNIVPVPGFTFAIQFGGDPGLRGGGPVANIIAAFVAPQTALTIQRTSAFVYGFRGNQVLQDTIDGAAVPEPGTLVLLATGLAGLTTLHRRRISR